MRNLAPQRAYKNPKDDFAKKLLESLLIENISAEDYRNNMFEIGRHLGETLTKSLDSNKRYCIVATAEDADFLARGIIESLEEHVAALYLTCFWNDRMMINEASVAPIYNKYFETGYDSADELIVIKSIMSGSCVVKTNITALFDKVTPTAIHVVAPVMHTESDQKLEQQFPNRIAKLFNYVYLAKDSQRKNSEVIPGIGGSVYEKLGFKSQKDKNMFLPKIITNKMFA